MAALPWVYSDGGRRAAGRKGDTGDCVVRAITIASGQDYSVVYDALAAGNAGERVTKRSRGPRGRTASHGIHVTRKWFKDYMRGMGWTFVATMGIGTGCKVHLAVGELPMGRLIVHVSKHVLAVIDGVIHDTYEDSRDGTRCVYGYWIHESENADAARAALARTFQDPFLGVQHG